MSDRPVRLTEAQRDALKSARDHGNPAHHIKGRSAAGGFTRTVRTLTWHGFLDKVTHAITPEGLAALEGTPR